MVTRVPKMLTANKRKLTETFDYVHNVMNIPHHIIVKFPQVTYLPALSDSCPCSALRLQVWCCVFVASSQLLGSYEGSICLFPCNFYLLFPLTVGIRRKLKHSLLDFSPLNLKNIVLFVHDIEM